MKLNTIIFDWDGTLGMTLHLWLAGYQHGLKGQGHEVDESIIVRDLFYHHDRAPAKMPQVDFTRLVSDAKAHMHDSLSDLKLYQHAKETLEQLQQAGVTLTLVTSSPRYLLEKGLAQHQMGDFFTSIIAGDDVECHKPHPEPFHKTLKAINAAPENTLIIGDSHVDIHAGQAAGTKTCLFTPPENQLFHNFDELRATRPDITIDSLDQLLKHF